MYKNSSAIFPYFSTVTAFLWMTDPPAIFFTQKPVIFPTSHNLRKLESLVSTSVTSCNAFFLTCPPQKYISNICPQPLSFSHIL